MQMKTKATAFKSNSKHLWKDSKGQKHNSISDILERYWKQSKQTKFIIDWERGELLVYEK